MSYGDVKHKRGVKVFKQSSPVIKFSYLKIFSTPNIIPYNTKNQDRPG